MELVYYNAQYLLVMGFTGDKWKNYKLAHCNVLQQDIGQQCCSGDSAGFEFKNNIYLYGVLLSFMKYIKGFMQTKINPWHKIFVAILVSCTGRGHDAPAMTIWHDHNIQ